MTDPETPFALLDSRRVERNAQRLQEHLAALGVPLRLHVKTAKSPQVAALVVGDAPAPIAASTLAEAEQFADAGYTDIEYAVGIAPSKLPRVLRLLRRGVDLAVLLDSADQAGAVAAASREAGIAIPALIEIDCDGHRSGLRPADPALVDIARLVADGAELRGVLTHAGESYEARSREELRAAADNERDAIVEAAERLRAEGFECPVVSAGSTPTAHAAADLTGVTEVRAGNFVFFDLVMAGLGVCELDDLALTVVVTVIGHQLDKGWVITDGGWTAMSRDQDPDTQVYGRVADLAGNVLPGLVMAQANQEHGILTIVPGSGATLPDLPIGTRLRMLPHHACATAEQHREYKVIDGGGTVDALPPIQATWPRERGW